VLLQGQGGQGEAGGSGAQHHAAAGEFEVHVAADGGDDVGQQPSGDEGAAVLGDGGGDGDVGGDLVVEAADAQLAVAGVQQEPGAPSGTLAGPAFAEAVAQVACAVGRDDTLPVLTGISLRHDQKTGTLTLAATDRYRFAVRTLPWKNTDLDADRTALVPGKPLLDAAKAAADDTTIDLALPGAAGSHGLFSLHSQHSTTTLRALEGDLPKYQSLFPTEFSQTATVEIAALKAAAQRVALVASKESPIRLAFTADSTLVLEAGTSDEAQAIDNVDTHLEGDELTIAFNPGFLIDGLNALTTEAVDFHFTTSTKPAVMRGHNSDDQALRYLLMPIRLKG
ncbi:DNA polymerase III subunit beta, partial [Streptomyces sp. WAC05858]